MTKQHSHQDARSTLELFIETAEEWVEFLSEDNNFAYMMTMYRNGDEEEWQIRAGIRGSLCILRMFVQSQDHIALYLLERDSKGQPKKQSQLLELHDVSDSWKETVERAHRLIDQALTVTLLDPIYTGTPITRREILEAFLYGKYVHANPIHRATLRQWQQTPELFGKLQFELISAVAFIFGQILEVAKASKDELSRLQANNNTARLT